MKCGNVIATGIGKGLVKESRGNNGVAKRSLAAGKATDRVGKVTAASAVTQKFLSVAQVAKRWGVSDSTVRRLIEEGRLNGIRLRHARRLSAVSVEEYEKSATF